MPSCMRSCCVRPPTCSLVRCVICARASVRALTLSDLPSVRPCFRPSTRPSFRASFRPQARLLFRPFVNPSLRPYVRPSFNRTSPIRPSVSRPPISLSVRPPVRHSIRLRSHVHTSVRSFTLVHRSNALEQLKRKELGSPSNELNINGQYIMLCITNSVCSSTRMSVCSCTWVHPINFLEQLEGRGLVSRYN